MGEHALAHYVPRLEELARRNGLDFYPVDFELTPSSFMLEGLDKHLRLIDSYKKLHAARARAAGL